MEDSRDNCLVAAMKRRNFQLVRTMLDSGSPSLRAALMAKDYCNWTALTFALAMVPTVDLQVVRKIDANRSIPINFEVENGSDGIENDSSRS